MNAIFLYLIDNGVLHVLFYFVKKGHCRQSPRDPGKPPRLDSTPTLPTSFCAQNLLRSLATLWAFARLLTFRGLAGRVAGSLGLDVAQAGQGVGAVDVHGARAADALPAGAAEGEGRILLVLDFEERIEDHRAAIVEVDGIGGQIRLLLLVRIPAVDLEIFDPLRFRGRGGILHLEGFLGEGRRRR